MPFSYWSIKPWFYYKGKTCCCAHHTFSLGVPNSATLINSAQRFSGAVAHIKIFWRCCRGERSLLQGESHTLNLFTLLLFFAFLFLFVAFYQKSKKISLVFIVVIFIV